MSDDDDTGGHHSKIVEILTKPVEVKHYTIALIALGAFILGLIL